MRILKVEPGKAPYAKEMEEGLKAIQREVEGLFQPLSMGDGVILCCNDEGKLNGICCVYFVAWQSCNTALWKKRCRSPSNG